MYGGDETSTPALPVHSQTQQHKVIVDDNLSSKNTSNKKKTKAPIATIKENHDTDEHISSSKYQRDEEINFNNYFNLKINAPISPQSKEQKPWIPFQSDDIQTPSTSISVQMDPASTFSTIKTQSDNKDDSTNKDVDELSGKLEVNISGKYAHTYIHTIFSLIFFHLKTIYFFVHVCMSRCNVFSLL